MNTFVFERLFFLLLRTNVLLIQRQILEIEENSAAITRILSANGPIEVRTKTVLAGDSC